MEVMDAYLNVSWLRPEGVVWDAMASYLIRKQGFVAPVLDLGSGNGIFSFVTAGGRFGIDFDWYIQVGVEGPSPQADIYDAPPGNLVPQVIRRPDYGIDVAVDLKQNLLDQASMLGLYNRLVQHDANKPLPFPNEEFATVFSNILYWLDEPAKVLRECHRVLMENGCAILCVPDPSFYTFCESYLWREHNSEWLRLLNGGRYECIRWTATQAELEEMATDAGFFVDYHRSYLKRRTLMLWDLGLRPLSRPLIRLVNSLTSKQRAEFKREWIAASRPLLKALLREEVSACGDGGFHLFVLRKA